MNIHEYPPQEPLSDFGRRHFDGMALRNPQLLSEEHAYAGNDPQRRLLFFRAAKPDAPVLVFFHGGGWTNGYKEYAAFMGPLFAQAGIAFVTAGYRLAPAHVFPTGWLDCADAVQRVWQQRAFLGLSERHFFVGGFSAGAHYASLLATRQDWLAPRSLPADLLAGCLSISGSYRFGSDAGFSTRPRFLGSIDAGNDISAAPLAHVEAMKTKPAFHVSHGERDFPHLVKQAGEFAATLERAGCDVTTLELPGCDHLDAGFSAGDPSGAWFSSARKWIEQRTAGTGVSS